MMECDSFAPEDQLIGGWMREYGGGQSGEESWWVAEEGVDKKGNYRWLRLRSGFKMTVATAKQHGNIGRARNY